MTSYPLMCISKRQFAIIYGHDFHPLIYCQLAALHPIRLMATPSQGRPKFSTYLGKLWEAFENSHKMFTTVGTVRKTYGTSYS